jgi:hypothetical protein
MVGLWAPEGSLEALEASLPDLIDLNEPLSGLRAENGIFPPSS